MHIAFIGIKSGTSLQRAKALERLGHSVLIIDPLQFLAPSRFLMRWTVHTGGLGASLYAYAPLRRRVVQSKCDLCWVDHGAFLGPSFIRSLRAIGVPLVSYMIDNAWSPIYKIKCRHYRAAIPYYDMIVQVRDREIVATRKAGARHIFSTYMCADEIAHRPRYLSDGEKKKYASEVAFIGIWLPERGPFLAELVRRGVPLSIWGNYWKKAPEWKTLAPYWRGPALNDAESYTAAILSAKICIGLVSKQVNDDCTTRSFEIPAVGGLLCAERTLKHRELYKEGEEAVFWDSADECARICHGLLANETRRVAIARQGRERALRNGYFNEPILAKILAETMRVNRPLD